MSKLVIVESPAKAKTIKKYLGSGYDVIASMGHVIDLPSKKLSVDVRNNFKPDYVVIEGKEDIVEKLTNKAAKSQSVYLATDPDREGEAISWHLARVLGLDLNDENRVEFNEITKNGIKKGMENPRKININLVNAQQARRILDRLVGYKLSPFLWEKIRKGLSAGRVQSAALRIIVDREEEINDFVPEESWSIDGTFLKKGEKESFKAVFYGDKKGKLTIQKEDEAKKILDKLQDAKYIVSKIKNGTRKKSPAAPFITSTLQQEASRKIGMRPRKAMSIAQQLYEGIEIKDMGAVGLITYMRTDSMRVSNEALSEAREYIKNNWSSQYLPEKPRIFKGKKGSQDAHEAIRPTMPKISPNEIKESLTAEQFKLYKLIWERFISSQMSECVQNTIGVDILGNGYIFKASGYNTTFDGFTALYEEDREEQASKDSVLFKLKQDDEVDAKEIEPNQHFTQPPPRYTEATLIKAMEKNGIGRPSTYATAVTIITSRDYVKHEKKILIPTELGIVITHLMKERFPNIVDIQFTAEMENDLDVIEEGENDWIKLLDQFYTQLRDSLKVAKEEMKGVKIELESDKTDIICDKCGKHMVIKVGRYGKFLACSGYPECKNIKNINKDGTVATEEQKNFEEPTDEICDKCGKPMVIKMGRYGKFVSCSGYPNCKNVKNIHKEIGVKCPKCNGNVIEKKSKKGKLFYGCDRYPDCDFVSWDEPVEEKCPKCSDILFKKKGKNPKIYCSKENCGYEREVEKDKK